MRIGPHTLLPDRVWWMLQAKRDSWRAVTTAFEADEDERFGSPGVAIHFHQDPLLLTLFLDARQHFSLTVNQVDSPTPIFAIDRVFVVNRPETILATVKRTLQSLPVSLEAARSADWQPIFALWRPLLIAEAAAS